MEDKKRKKDDKRKRETSQKVAEQKNKVSDPNKPAAPQFPATQCSSASPSPGSTPSASPSPAAPGPGSSAVPPQGANNAKRPVVANGQPPPAASGNGSAPGGGSAQAPQQPRYMLREVPPRFRSQQDHKVLLKRGQPPPSSMLLEGAGDSPNANMTAASDAGAAASSLGLASSATAATCNYANSMWGAGSGSQASPQGREKVIVDGNDLEEWPSIDGGGAVVAMATGDNNGMPVKSSVGASGSQFPPSLPTECTQPPGVVWGTAAPQGHVGGPYYAPGMMGVASSIPGPPPLSKASAVPGCHDDTGGVGIPGANFNPNANPSAWPALVQQDGLTPPSSVNHANGHQHQAHQMQPRDSEVGGGGGSAGPKMPVGEGDCGEGDHSSLPPSWRGQPPPPAANAKTGASRTYGWGEGGSAAADGDNGTSGWGCSGAGSTWGGAQAPEASQGGWGGAEGDRGAPPTAWGGSCVGVQPGDGSGSGSGGSSITGAPPPLPAAASPPAASRAWDNQKEGEVGEWGTGPGGGKGGSSSSGGTSGGGLRGPRAAPSAQAALQGLLSRDLDPRVLSNTGWGHTHIRQNTAWELEGEGRPSSPGPAQCPAGPVAHSDAAGSCGEAWDSSSTSSSSGASSRGPPPSGRPARNMPQQGRPSGWGGGRGGGWGEGPEERGGGGWGGGQRGGAREWGEREAKSHSGGGGGGWGEERKAGTSGENSDGGSWGSWDEAGPRRPWGGGGGGEGDLGPKPHASWNRGHPTPHSQPVPAPLPQPHSQQPEGWGRTPASQGPAHSHNPGWAAGPGPSGPAGGGGAGVSEPSGWEEPSPQSISRKNEIDDGTSAWGDPSRHNYKPVNRWDKNSDPAGQKQQVHGPGQPQPQQQQPQPQPQQLQPHQPQPHQPQQQQPQPHQPQPHQPQQQQPHQPQQQQPHQPQPHQPQPQQPHQQQSQSQGPPVQKPAGRQAPGPMGNRDINPNHGPGKALSMAQSGWGRTSPSSPTVDNGTSAWGKPSEAPTGWGDPDDAAEKPSSWGNPAPNPTKPGSKSMQDGWGENEGSMAASRHSSWEEEEDGGGGIMWNSAGSQGSSSSWGQGSNGGWGGQPHAGKKAGTKAPPKAGDSWMNPVNRQFANMGLLGDDPSGRSLDLAPGPLQDKKMEADKRGMAMSDYNGEMRKGGRGGSMSYRPPGAKELGASDAGLYYDKTLPFTNQDGCLGEEGPCSLHSPPTVYKSHPLYNHTLPLRQGSHNMFGIGGGPPQSRHQPSVPPINPSPGIRAQVPHQYLSPQVPGPVLKQMPPPSGAAASVGAAAGAVFPPQLSPQHIAMLSSIYPPHIQFQLACQLLLQQPQQQQQQLLQNQRKFPQNVRQQADPQQLARIMAVLQQQRQQQGVGGLGSSSKLSPSHMGVGGVGGSKLPGPDPLPHPGLGVSVADLHQKTHGGYSGFGSGVNLPGLDLGGSAMGVPSGMKDPGGQQSRFKWMMEAQSPADPAPPDGILHKNGPITPIKMPGSSPYSQYDMLGGEDSWHRTPGNKMGSKAASTTSWPPEFQPGVPWKGIDRVDPESDPYMTPGSMMGHSPSPSLNDSDHQLLQDNADSTPPLNTLLPSRVAWPYSASDSPLNNAHSTAKYTEYKTSWPPEPIGHNKPWKARGSNQSQSRPPPGLASQKQSSPSPWAGGGPRLAGRGWGSGSGNTGSSWSDGSARGSCWLVLSNLTPQIDGSTLRTICMQHGPLLTFHLGLTQGTALIRYNSEQEAAKAQSALHMCVLGNTTILAEFVSEEEVARYIAHSQAGGGGGSAGGAGSSSVGSGDRGGGVGDGGPGQPGGLGSSSWQSLDRTGGTGDPTGSQGPSLGVFAQWSSSGGGGGAMEAGRQGLWGGMGGAGYPSSSLWGSPALDDRHQMGSPAALLPGDLLGGGADSI